MVKKTDSVGPVTDQPVCSHPHCMIIHRLNAMDAFFKHLFLHYPKFMQDNFSKYGCCGEDVSPADWPLLAQLALTDYELAPPTCLYPETRRPKTNGVNASSPSTSPTSTSLISNQNGDALVLDEDNEVLTEKEKQKQDDLISTNQPPSVVEIVVVEPAPEAVPRPCSVIRHVSSDSLASLVAPPEPSPVISPCSSPSPSPDPTPTSAANDNSADDAGLQPLAQSSSNVDFSSLNQDRPSLPEDDDQSGNSTDTELAPENHPATNGTCHYEVTTTIPEPNLVDKVTLKESESVTEAPDKTIGLEKIKSESDSEMSNTPPCDRPTSTLTSQSIQPNGQNIMKPTEQNDDVLIVDLTNDEVTTPPESHTNDEVPRPPGSLTNDEEVTPPPGSHASDEEVIVMQSPTINDEVNQPESCVKESRKRKLNGCTSAIAGMSDKHTEPSKQHWKKNIATPFIKGNSSVAFYPPKTYASTAAMNDDASASGSIPKGYVTRIDSKTNKMRLPDITNGTNDGAPPPKKIPHTTVSDSPPAPPLSRRERRPTLLPPPKRKHDDSSDTSSLESSGEIDQDDDEDKESGINPALYPDVELRENQSQDKNHPPPVSDADDCVVLDDDSQQPEEIQLLPAPILNTQSIPPPAQSSSAGLLSKVVPSGPPSERSEKSDVDVSSEETIVDHAFSDSSEEGQESDPDIMIVEENMPRSAAAIPYPNANSVQIIPNTAENNQMDSGRGSENEQGALTQPASLQQPVNGDSKFSEYRRHFEMGSSGKVAEINILEKQNESSLSCDDEDTDIGSQKNQDPRMPVLRLPVPVSPSNENGNANVEAPALILHPGDRVPSVNESGPARMEGSEIILNTEEDEDRDMGGVGEDEKSDEETERSHIVQRRSRRKRRKSTKLNGFTNDELKRVNAYGETDDEGLRNVADETLNLDEVSNGEEENDEESRSDRIKTTDQRWFHSEHKNFATLTIRRGKLQENADWRQAKQDDFPLTQRSKKRGRGRPKKHRRSDTDTEGGWRGPNHHQSSSRPSATTDYYCSSNDDEPLINKKVRTQSLSAMGVPRSGDISRMVRHEEDDNEENFPDRQEIAGPSPGFYQTLSQQSTSNSTITRNVPVVISLSGDDDDVGYVEDTWPHTTENSYGHPSNPADVSVYTERLSGVEDPDATTVVDFLSEHSSQASTTTAAASLSSTPGRGRGRGRFRQQHQHRKLKRGIIVECPNCHREVSNHFLRRHQRSNLCDRNRPPRPVGGAMTDYDNDSQTEAELDDDMNGDHHQNDQQQRRKRGRPRGSKNKMGECRFCNKKMLLSSVRNHVTNAVCPESRLARKRGEPVDYLSQDDSQTEDEGWDHNENEYENVEANVMSTSAPSSSPVQASVNPVSRVSCPGCGLSMLRTSLRNHLNQKRCKGQPPTSSPAASSTISTNSTHNTNTNHSTTTTNQNDDVVEGSGTGTGEQSQGYLTNKRERSCRRVAKKYNCDDDDDDVGSNIETEYDGYDRVVSSPLPPAQQIYFEDCPYADCNYTPVDEKDHENHTNEEHPPGEGFPCNSCNRVYISRLNLETHQRTHIHYIPYDATMVSYMRNPALQPSVIVSSTDYLVARQAVRQ